MEINDHFRNAHLKFSVKTQGLLNLLLKQCHIAIKRRAIKLEVASGAALLLEGFAARATNRILPGFLQFMRNTMQPANHGAVRV